MAHPLSAVVAVNASLLLAVMGDNESSTYRGGRDVRAPRIDGERSDEGPRAGLPAAHRERILETGLDTGMRWALTCIAAMTLTGCWGFSHTIKYGIEFKPEAVQPEEPLLASVDLAAPNCSVRWAEYFWIPYGRSGEGWLLIEVPNTSTDALTIDLSRSSIVHAGRSLGLSVLLVYSGLLAAAELPVATILPGEKFVAGVCPVGLERTWGNNRQWCDLWAWVGEGSDAAQPTSLILSGASSSGQFTITRQFRTEVNAERSRKTWWIFGPGG